jgi:hypothetical protein
MDIITEGKEASTFEHEKGVKKDEIKGEGPDKADGVEKAANENVKPRSVKEFTNTVKIESGKINTNMNEKNIFDKLYSTIMENDEDFDMGQLDAGLGDEEGLGGEDEGAGEVTITLTPEQADVLKDVLGQLDGGDMGDDIEDLDGAGDEDALGDLEDSSNPFPEAVDATHTSDGNQPGQDPTHLGPGKKNVVPGTASKTTSGGARSDVTDKVGNDGHAKDSTAALTSTSSRSNVVSGKISGNNQGLLA